MLSTLRKLLTDKSGATAIEYGLIASLIAIGAIAGLNAVGESLFNMLDTVATVITDATPK